MLADRTERHVTVPTDASSNQQAESGSTAAP